MRSQTSAAGIDARCPDRAGIGQTIRSAGRGFTQKNKLPKMIEAKNIISGELEGIHDLDFTPAGAGADRDDARTGSATTGASG